MAKRPIVLQNNLKPAGKPTSGSKPELHSSDLDAVIPPENTEAFQDKKPQVSSPDNPDNPDNPETPDNPEVKPEVIQEKHEDIYKVCEEKNRQAYEKYEYPDQKFEVVNLGDKLVIRVVKKDDALNLDVYHEFKRDFRLYAGVTGRSPSRLLMDIFEFYKKSQSGEYKSCDVNQCFLHDKHN